MNAFTAAHEKLELVVIITSRMAMKDGM